MLLGRDRVDLAALLTWLADQGYLRALTEGGPALLADILPWVDDPCLTTVPTLLGGVDPARPMPDLFAGHPGAADRCRDGAPAAGGRHQLTRWKLRHGWRARKGTKPDQAGDTTADFSGLTWHYGGAVATAGRVVDVKGGTHGRHRRRQRRRATDAAAGAKAKVDEVTEKVKDVVSDLVEKHADKPAGAVKTTTDFVDDKTGGKTAPVSEKVNQAAQAATHVVKGAAGVDDAPAETPEAWSTTSQARRNARRDHDRSRDGCDRRALLCWRALVGPRCRSGTST